MKIGQWGKRVVAVGLILAMAGVGLMVNPMTAQADNHGRGKGKGRVTVNQQCSIQIDIDNQYRRAHISTQKPVQGQKGFGGIWSTPWGEMRLSQAGGKVTGTYAKNQGRITGTAAGLTLVGTWSEAPDYSVPDHAGSVLFILRPNGKAFAGWYREGALGPWKSLSATRTGTVTPPPVVPVTPQPANPAWSGTWATTWGEMKLIQDGTKLIGTYQHASGKVSGTFTNRTFTGIWSEAPDYTAPYNAGELVLWLSADGKTLTGKWRYGTSGDWQTNWKGTLGANETPTTDARVWSGSWATTRGLMKLTVSGNRVTGTFSQDNGQFSGTVSGNTLTGVWSKSPTYAAPNDSGDAVLTMGQSGKNFSGQWRTGNSGAWQTWDGILEF
ncbi:MAG: hypothetical protein ACM3QZ_13685 [Solirubrobacterales bacterium]